MNVTTLKSTNLPVMAHVCEIALVLGGKYIFFREFQKGFEL
jgi:hypothetical protein